LFEIFAGSARLTQAFIARNLAACALDIVLQAEDDVRVKAVERAILDKIRRRLFKLVWLGHPCSSWSRARRNDGRGPPPLRDDHEFLMGFLGLGDKDKIKVSQGNRMLHFCSRVIDACIQHKVAWALENPATSRVWLTKPMKNLEKQGHLFVTLDFCQFGEPWRKRTKIIHGNIDLSSIGKLCQGKGGVCSRTGKKHIQLVGTDAKKQFLTRKAQPYPMKLCHDIAEIAHRVDKG